MRERPEDIVPLLIDFTEEFSEKINKPIEYIADEVFEVLQKYSFPGNIRELRNLTERAIILSEGKSLEVSDFPLPAIYSATRKKDYTGVNLKNNEVELIRKALEDCDFNQTIASEILGISRYSLIRKMQKYNIDIVKTDTKKPS